MIFLWNSYIINHIRPVKNYIFYRVRFVVKPENVLTDTAFSQDGYDVTWLRLKARYQLGKILVFAAIAKMIDNKPIDGSSRQLKTLHGSIKNSISTLKNIDVSTKSWDTAFSQGGYDDTCLRLKARYQIGKILVFAAIAKIIDHNPTDGSSRQLRALHETINNSMSTLINLDVSTKFWDPILCFIIRRKLDQQSLAALKNSADAPIEIPLLRSVLTFIERRTCMLVVFDQAE